MFNARMKRLQHLQSAKWLHILGKGPQHSPVAQLHTAHGHDSREHTKLKEGAHRMAPRGALRGAGRPSVEIQ